MSHCAGRVADITSRTTAFLLHSSLIVWGDYTPKPMNHHRPEYWEENLAGLRYLLRQQRLKPECFSRHRGR